MPGRPSSAHTAPGEAAAAIEPPGQPAAPDTAPVTMGGRGRRRKSRTADTTRAGRPVLSSSMGAALGVVVVLITVLAIPSKQWLTQRARIASLEESLSVTRASVDDLTQTAQRWQDPAYIEAQARARLHFVRPGEVGYVVLTDEHQQESTAGTQRALATVPSGGPWWSAVWSTVTEAAKPGDPDAPPAPAPAQAAPEYGP